MAIDGVKIEGLNSTVRSLQKLGVEITDLKAAFRKVGDLVAHDAKQLINNRTGRLANSIRPGNTKNKAIVRAGSAGVPYAEVIHWGNYNNIQPQMYLTKAAEQNQDESVRLIEQELRGLIIKLGLRN